MKLFIVTTCTDEGNRMPTVFNTFEEAKCQLKLVYDKALFDRDEDGNIIYEYDICAQYFTDTYCNIVYNDYSNQYIFLRAQIWELDQN